MQPASFYHIYTHANGNENLFRTDENYRFFLKKFVLHINPVADTYCYCLMPNHIHFLIRIKEEEELRAHLKSAGQSEETSKVFKNLGGLSPQAFSNLFNSYTKSYNKVFSRRGSLFIPNFKRKEIKDDAYLTRVIQYIHFNPVHHGFVKDIRDWPHSSYHSLLHSRETSLKREEVLAWFGGAEEFCKLHDLYKEGKIAIAY
jgi:putative transposase